MSRDLDRSHSAPANRTRQTLTVGFLLVALHAVAIGASGLGGCGTSEPVVGRFERRFEEIDRARWEATCGTYSEREGEFWPGGPLTRRATFSNASTDPMPKLETGCVAIRTLDDPALRIVGLSLYSHEPRLLVERQPALLELLWPLVPEHVWPCVLITANSPVLSTCKAFGFRVQAGYISDHGRVHSWSLEMSDGGSLR